MEEAAVEEAAVEEVAVEEAAVEEAAVEEAAVEEALALHCWACLDAHWTTCTMQRSSGAFGLGWQQ